MAGRSDRPYLAAPLRSCGRQSVLSSFLKRNISMTNGYWLDIPEELAIDTFLSLAVGTVDEIALAEILATHCTQNTSPAC